MMSCIGTNCQRAHAVSEKDQRNTREMIPDQAVHRMDIPVQHGIRPTTVHIPKILFTAYAFPMATVITDHTYIFSRSIFHKLNVAFLVLTHSVNDLYDPTVFLITFQLRHYC